MTFHVRIYAHNGFVEYEDKEAQSTMDAMDRATYLMELPATIMVRTIKSGEINWAAVPAKTA